MSDSARQKPADVVTGHSPAFTTKSVTVPAYECSCGHVALGDDAEAHLKIAHPAHRDPAITCHAAPPWDHERWCLRAKGHEGDHWTPNMHGGSWWKAHLPGGAS